MANILQDVQDFVVGKLSADYQLSGMCTFLAENRKDIDYEIKNALGRQGIVGVVLTPKATYAGKYENSFIAWQLDELEIDIVENPIVNRGKKDGYITGQDASMHLFEVLCPKDGPYEGQLNPVSYEEGEDGGLIVNRCILKTLVYGEEGPGPEPTPTLNMYFVKLLDEVPPLSVQPRDGWMWPTDSGFVVWQNGQAHELGVSFDQISSYVESAISAKADLSDVHGDYIEDADGNKIEADRTFTWREKCSWYVSEMNGGTYTYDPPLECVWGTYTIDNGQSQTQTQLWMSKTPYTNNEYFGIGANLGYVEYYDKVGEIFVAVTGDAITEHTDNSITKIGMESCSITRTGEWSDRTATLATEEWVSGRDFIQDSAGNKIEADRDFTYFDSNNWSVDVGTYGKYVLSPMSSEEWTYAETEGTEGNKKLVLKWVDYMQDWELSYYQWSETILGWSLLAQGVGYDTQQATSLEIEITGDFTATAECRKGAPSTDKLATEGYVNGIVGNINTILDIINGEVI